MPNLSVDTFRELQGDKAIVLSGANGQELRTASMGHRLKTFFNIGTARAENRQLVERFKATLRQDPRYFALGDRIESLVGQIRTDRSVHADVLRAVVRQLDQMSSYADQMSALTRLTAVHVAARGGAPECCQNFGNEYTKLAQKYVGSRAGDAYARRKTPLASTDIALELADFDDLVGAMMAQCGNDEDLKQVVGQHLYTCMVKPDASVRSKEEALRQVEGFRTALSEVQTRADNGLCSKELCLDIIAQCSKAPKAGTFARALDVALASVPSSLNALSFADRSDVPAIHAAFVNLCLAARSCVNELAKNDPDVATNLTSLFMRTALDALPRETRVRLNGFLSKGGPGASLVRAYLTCEPPTNVLAAKLPGFLTSISTLIEQLRLSTGLDLETVDEEIDSERSKASPKSAEEIGLSPGDLYLFGQAMLTDKEKATAELVHFADLNLLSTEQKQAFDSIRTGLATEGKPDAEILAKLNDPQTPEAALLNHPRLVAAPASIARARETVTAIRDELASRVDQRQISDGLVAYLEELLLADLAAMPPEARPSGEALKEYVRTSPFIDLAVVPPTQKSLTPPLTQGDIMARMLKLGPESRRAFAALLQAFGRTHDPMLALNYTRHEEQLLALYREGNLTRATAYRAITGEEQLPPELAEDRNDAGVREYFTDHAVDLEAVKAFGAKRGLTTEQYGVLVGPITSMILEGVDMETAYKVALREIPKPTANDRHAAQIVPSAVHTLDELEGDVSVDLPRFTSMFAIDGKEVKITGARYAFVEKDGNVGVFDTKKPEEYVTGDDAVATFMSGHKTNFSYRMKREVLALCGPYNELQARAVLTALGQCALAPIKEQAELHGIVGNEHSPATWTVSRQPNGNVRVHVSEPKGCPFKFSWTYEIDQHGRTEMTEQAVFVPPGEEHSR